MSFVKHNTNVPIVGSCMKKSRFKKESQAAAVAERMRAKGRTNAHAYRCEYCKKWHVTTMSREDVLEVKNGNRFVKHEDDPFQYTDGWSVWVRPVSGGNGYAAYARASGEQFGYGAEMILKGCLFDSKADAECASEALRRRGMNPVVVKARIVAIEQTD